VLERALVGVRFVESGLASRCTGRAETPVHDLSFIDHKAMVGACGEAGSVARGTVNIGDSAAGAANHMVVVIAHPRLVAGDRSGWFDLTDQAYCGERSQNVINGLRGYARKITAHCRDDRVRIGMGMRVDGLQNM
jgi:hypothetical protein